jgi:Tol biopolymer transport system component
MNAGTRLGPYEILSRIGAGGMGEVWRANDTRLGRAVAVKILPAEFGANAQLRGRFEREARTISQLNHPHICTLFDVGENYLVMELLEGETLAERLAKGPLTLAEVLRYGAQIADALDKAHRQGVVHRDLKPGNVMITKGGAKLLDFGLAKAAVLEVNLDGATEHRPLTQEGTILGTFQYMSPEQLEGQNVDHRSDIFALGVLLYEMLTGRRAFDGKTKTSLIAAIVSAEPPPLSQVQPLTPPALEHVIRKSLAKDPEARWQSAHDIGEELRWIGELGSQAGVAAPVASARRMQRRTLIAAAIAGWLLALTGAIGAWWMWKRADAAERPLRAEIAPPEGARLAPINQGSAVLSPDGTHLAFVAGSVGRMDLHVRDMTTGRTAVLQGTSGAGFPFWSPDGRSLGFFADGKLKIVPAAGGGVQELAAAAAGRGGTWSPAGVIVFAPDIDAALHRVSIEGGAATPATRKTRPQQSHRNPHFLADGERFLYTVRDDTMTAASVHAGSLDGKVDRKVMDKGSNVAVHAGYILFFRSGNLVAQRFDEDSLTVSGSPQPIAEQVEYFNARDVANFSVSRNGLLVYRSNASRLAQPTWYSADGKVIGPAAPEGIYRTVRLSRDGRRILLVKGDGTGVEDLWITDVERGATSRATFANAGLIFGALSPDGSRLAVSSSLTGKAPAVWTQSTTGAGGRQEVYRGEESIVVHEWSPDGSTLVTTTQRNDTGFDVAIMDARTGKFRHILNGPYEEFAPTVSPDGRWLAYISNESGRNQVYVTDLPDASRKWQVSLDGGGGPEWSRDGTEIIFGSSGAQFGSPGSLFSVRVRPGKDGLAFEAPRRLPFNLDNSIGRAVAPDGRVLLVQGKPVTTPYHLVTNWTRTLAQ